MCPIWPLHLIIIYLLALFPLWSLCQVVPKLTASFDPAEILIHMEESHPIPFNITGLAEDGFEEGDMIQLSTGIQHIADTDFIPYELKSQDIVSGWSGVFKLNGKFLGKTEVYAKVNKSGKVTAAEQKLSVTVIRAERVIDKVFTYSVVTLVAFIFINFGCAMDWPTVKAVCKRPIGPAIGFAGQFVIMPLLSYFLGLMLFPDDTNMRLGLFFTGCSPAGGASNIWTYILGGNLNLSLAMTTISTLAAFGMLPLWLFTLGAHIFGSSNIGMPYRKIATFVVGLVVPLGIGLAMQKFTPKSATFMVRMLKCFSAVLLVFIIVFAIVTNLYLFELFSWQIVAAGMGIPWLGYCLGYAFARILRQSHSDSLAISIETGVQNTGIAIFLLRFSLPQPEADLTTVIPVAVAIMTPIPMMIIYALQKIRGCINNKNKHKKIVNFDDSPDVRFAPIVPVVSSNDLERPLC